MENTWDYVGTREGAHKDHIWDMLGLEKSGKDPQGKDKYWLVIKWCIHNKHKYLLAREGGQNRCQNKQELKLGILTEYSTAESIGRVPKV